MDETALRILDALARNLGRDLSIQELTGEIRRLQGRAYYANTHRGVQKLEKEGLVRISRSGRAAAVSLELHRYLLRDHLTELELRRKRSLLAHAKRAEGVFEALDRTLRDLPVDCACTIDTERNLRLHRLELLVLAREPDAASIPEKLGDLARRLPLRIDHLALSPGELLVFLGAEDRNPLPEMVGRELAVYLPQNFWAALAEGASRGRRLRVDPPLDLRNLSQPELTYNLARLGYPLLGAGETGEALSLETTVLAALLSGHSRQRTGAGVLLAKNDFHPRLLTFLALKHGVAGDLLRLLTALKPTPKVKELRARLDSAGAKRAKGRTQALKRSLEVYDAVG